MRTFRRLAILAVALCFFAVCNVAATLALEPYDTHVNAKWDQFQGADADTVFIGNSLMEVGIIPSVFDEAYGSTSYNLGSSAQLLDETYCGLSTVLEKKDVDLAVVGTELAYVQDERAADPGRPFMRSMSQYDSLFANASDNLYLLSNWQLLTSTDSINWMFPYTKNHVKLNFKAIKKNLESKLTHNPSILEASCANNTNYKWLGQGYFGRTDVRNFNEGDQSTYRQSFEEITDFNPRNFQAIEHMCDLCREKGVTFVVILPPIARFNALDYGEVWYEQANRIREMVEAHGGVFYDCNMLKTEYFSFDDKYYYDIQHLNIEGAGEFSKVFAEILRCQQNGEDTSRFFYTWDEYLQSFNEVAFVQMSQKKTDAGVELEARALVSEGVQVEYQFLSKKAGESDWTMLREWSTDATCLFAPSEGGEHQVRVNARTVGSSADYQHYRTLGVTV